MSFATPTELVELAQDLGVQAPLGADAERLLAKAWRDVQVLALGTRMSDAEVEALTDKQRQALAEATCAQALWREEGEDLMLGPADVTGLPDGITLARDRPRLSPMVLEAVALLDVIAYSGLARQPPADPEEEDDEDDDDWWRL